VNVVEERLTLPLLWKQPRKIFVNSQSDLFHEDVSFAVIDRAFAVMALCPQHTFQILTKRPERMREYMEGGGIVGGIHGRSWRVREAGHAMKVPIGDDVNFALPLPNVWLGTSVENQKAADERIPELLATPAAVRFLSCEPLLGPVNIASVCTDPPNSGLAVTDGFGRFDGEGLSRLHWVIVGGESGPNTRPMHPDWARSLRDQCQKAAVPFFFKQWGEWAAIGLADDVQRKAVCDLRAWRWMNFDGGHGFHGRRVYLMRKDGKKRAGRELDGRKWDEFPEVEVPA
jgi:protein gp37